MNLFRPISSVMAMGLLALSLNACVLPTASQSTQSSPLRKGDGFTLLNPAPDGHPMQKLDAIVMREATARTGPSSSGTRYLLEYSYAVRPAAIAMKSDAAEHGLSIPASDAMLECADTSHRVTVRITAKDNGAQSFRGTAERVGCGSELVMDEAVFTELLGLALGSLTVE